MTGAERLISFPDTITIGTTTITRKPISKKESKERAAFSIAIMQTPEYKKYLQKGDTRSVAIERAAVDIQTNQQGRWYSIKRLPPKLQKIAKKYWVK